MAPALHCYWLSSCFGCFCTVGCQHFAFLWRGGRNAAARSNYMYVYFLQCYLFDCEMWDCVHAFALFLLRVIVFLSFARPSAQILVSRSGKALKSRLWKENCIDNVRHPRVYIDIWGNHVCRNAISNIFDDWGGSSPNFQC